VVRKDRSVAVGGSSRGIVLAMARVKQDLRDQLERIGLITHIGEDCMFATPPVALEAFERRGQAGREES
jgi:SulP family sulfate permease